MPDKTSGSKIPESRERTEIVSASSQPAMVAFSKWIAEGEAQAAKLADEDFVAAGIEIAKKRRDEMYALMAEDPRAFVDASLSQEERAALPESIIQFLPNVVEGRGDLEWLAAAPKEGEELPARPMYRVATVDEETFDAYVYGNRENQMTQLGIPMRGLSLDDRIVILESSARTLQGEERVEALNSDDTIDLAMEEHIADFPSTRNPLLMYGGEPIRVCCEDHAGMVGNVPESEWPTAAWNGDSSSGDGITAASSWTEGDKKVLAILVDFPDLTGAPETNGGTLLDATYITDRINDEVHVYYDETSYGKTGMVTMTASDVTPVLRMPQNAQTYAENDDNTGLRVDSSALAQAAGYDLEDYDRIFLVFKSLGTFRFPASQITYGGLGQIGNKFMWMNGSFGLGLAVHELGHTYGLGHASRWEPTNANPIDPAGSLVEYGDVFDEMGSGPSEHPLHPSAFNPLYLNRLDWLPDSAIQNVTYGGTVRVYRFDHENANPGLPRAITISRDQDYTYWIGYRRKFAGHPSRGDMALGAYLFRAAPDGTGKTELLDIDTPGSNANDASLNIGNTYDDAAGGIEIEVLSAGGSGADEYLDIAIQFDPRIQITTPTLDVDEQGGVANLVLSRTGNDAGVVSVNWSTSDGTATSPADFTAASNTVTWANGDMADKTISIPLVADATIEGREDFTINLSGISGGVLVGASSATVNIVEAGASDSSFSHPWFSYSGSAHEFAVQPDGKIAFVGRNESVGGIDRLFPDGSADEDFRGQGDGANVTAVRTIARQPDGKLVVGGDFTTVRGASVTRVARLNVDGSLDTGFNPGTGPNGIVRKVIVQPDGKILIGGNFSSVNGVARQGVARLNADGSLDTTFFASSPPGANTINLETMALQPDGKVLIGGFIYANWNALFDDFSSGIWRLNADGSIDMSFDIGEGAHAASGSNSLRRVYAIAVQPDGKVLVGGEFDGFAGTANRPRLVRLNTNGSVDTAFQTALGSGPDDDVRTLALQNDGGIMVGGQFKNFAGSSRLYAARVSPSGAFDNTFDASLNEIVPGGSYGNWVRNFAFLPDGKLLIAQEIWGNEQRVIAKVFSGISGLAGTLEFSGGTFSAIENTSAQVTVSRTGGSTGAIQVAYSTVGGTATEGVDYPLTAGVLSWADGDSADKTISIPITADATVEPTESFSVQLAVPVGGAFIGNQAISQVNISSAPLIQIEEPANTPLTDGSSVIDFENVEISQTAQRTVTIRNTGGGILENLAVSVEGSNLVFPAGSLSTNSLAPNATTTFTIGFSPTATGTQNATLHIDSNDSSNSRFSVGLTGTGVSPEISVEEPVSTTLIDGSSTRNFGAVALGNSANRVFTIRNTGTGTLSGLSAAFTGASAGSFSSSAFGATSLAPNATTTVTVSFTPSTSGAKSATLQIASNDADENPFDIQLTGTGGAPEINVEEPVNTSLVDGATTTSFGSVPLSQNSVKTFTIRNTGGQPLTGLGLSVGGTNSGDFAAANLSATSLASNATATFTVTFTPGAGGSRNATLQIASNDSDENPFDINLSGLGADPEIEVEYPAATALTDGSSTVDWGAETVGQPASKTFTIRNSGTTTLSGLSISFAGTNASDFSAGSLPATIAPGATATVSVSFNPGAPGARSASLVIASNDADENPFNVNLTGSGLTSEITIEEPVNTPLTDGSTTIDYGEQFALSQSVKTFTIRNEGTGDLINLSLSVGGAHAGQFVAGNLGATTLAPGASTTFTVAFEPTGEGVRAATLQVVNNDPDENPFNISLQGSARQRTTLESWAQSFGLSGAALLPTADGDGDGISLLAEYGFNLDPTRANVSSITPGGSDTGGLPSIRVVNDRLEIQFIRRLTDPDLSYDPQFSNSPVAASFVSGTDTIVVTPINDEFERATILDAETTATEAKRFGRVNVILTDP